MGNLFTKKSFLVIDLETFNESTNLCEMLDSLDDREIIRIIKRYCDYIYVNTDVKVWLYRWIIPNSAMGIILVLKADKITIKQIIEDAELKDGSYRIINKKELHYELLKQYC
jgi:hypothetical protein